jgi:hypothetical protein
MPNSNMPKPKNTMNWKDLESQLQTLTDRHGFTAVMFALGELMRDLPDSDVNRKIADAASHLDNACLETAIAEDKIADLNTWVEALTSDDFDDIDSDDF